MRFGSVWLARIGILLLLTGLVFLGNYAWHNWIANLGAPGRLAMLVLAAGALLGIGRRLESRHAALGNYGRVLMGGGLATLYYAAYAAAFVDRLRVLPSPWAGGVLLLGLAGWIVWLAVRRGSEALATITILLAFYTSAINPAPGFTPVSTVLLAAAAVWCLVRQGWAAAGTAGLVGAYGAHAWWWMFREGNLFRFAPDPALFAPGLAMLAGYWALMAAGAVLAPARALGPVARITFLSASNAGFFALAAVTVLHRDPGEFWKLALAQGIAILGAGAASRLRRGWDAAFEGGCLAQGLLLLTVALAAKLAGTSLALALGVESALLLAGSRHRLGWLTQLAAGATALAATILALLLAAFNQTGALAGAWTLAVVMAVCGWLVRRLRNDPAAPDRLDWRAVVFCLFGCVLALVALRDGCGGGGAFPAVAAAIPVALLFGAPRIGLPELAVTAQLLTVAAWARWIEERSGAAWWVAPCVAGAAWVQAWWMERPNGAPGPRLAGLAGAWICAFAAALISIDWLPLRLPEPATLWLPGLAALALLALGIALRSVAIAATGQILAWAGVLWFGSAMEGGGGAPFPALAGVAVLALNAVLLGRRLRAVPHGDEDLGNVFAFAAACYRLVANLMLIAWVFEYVPAEWRLAVFLGAGALFLAWGALRRDAGPLWMAALPAIVGIGTVWFDFRSERPFFWADFAAVLLPASVLAVQRRLAPAAPLPTGVRAAVLWVANATLFVLVTRWFAGTAFPLTLAWVLLAPALFVAGIAFRERAHRLSGLAVLAIAGLRVMFVDAWQLDELPRILVFLTAGVVALGLGYAYARHGAKFRDWL